jgi:HNH endonuclease
MGVMVSCAFCGCSFTSRHGRIYCSPACAFWTRVDRSGGPDACWPWIDHLSATSGYGDVPGRYNEGKRASAHRLAWRLHNCCDPGKLCVLHQCDNRKCANPAQLFLGSKRRNVLDAWMKGRFHACAPGEAHPSSKLTDLIVTQIRQGQDDPLTLAARYGVRVSTINAARRGHTWKHLPVQLPELVEAEDANERPTSFSMFQCQDPSRGPKSALRIWAEGS